MATLPADYPERAYAAVLGKLIGVYLGRPFEGWTYQRICASLGRSKIMSTSASAVRWSSPTTTSPGLHLHPRA